MPSSRRSCLVLVAVVLVGSLAACRCQISTANITGAKMARDKAGEDVTTVFAPTDKIWCIVDLANAPSSTEVEARWFAVEVAGVPADQQIQAASITTGDTPIFFSLTPDPALTPGTYAVEIHLDGKLDRKLTFTVGTP